MSTKRNVRRNQFFSTRGQDEEDVKRPSMPSRKSSLQKKLIKDGSLKSPPLRKESEENNTENSISDKCVSGPTNVTLSVAVHPKDTGENMRAQALDDYDVVMEGSAALSQAARPDNLEDSYDVSPSADSVRVQAMEDLFTLDDIVSKYDALLVRSLNHSMDKSSIDIKSMLFDLRQSHQKTLSHWSNKPAASTKNAEQKPSLALASGVAAYPKDVARAAVTPSLKKGTKTEMDESMDVRDAAAKRKALTYDGDHEYYKELDNPEEWASKGNNGEPYNTNNEVEEMKPGAIKVSGPFNSDNDQESEYTPMPDLEAPPPPPPPPPPPDENQFNETPDITTAELVTEKDVDLVSAVPELPWIRQKRNQRILLALALAFIGAILGLAIPLTSKSEASSADAPENDLCSNAIGSLPIPSSTKGTTFSASLANVNECGGVMAGETRGVWYTIEGTGNTISASTCNNETLSFDTQLSVYTGDCASLECVGGNDNACGLQSRFNWISIPGKKYYVLIHGRGATGEFRLDIEEPENDVCESSIGPLSIPSFTEGSTTLATSENITKCGSLSATETVGVWYTIVGTGSSISVSTCNEFFTETTTFDTEISVFTGRCSSLECIGGNDNDNVCGLQSRFNWDSILGQVYHVLVHGRSETGEFRLNVEEVQNDFCDGAVGNMPVPYSIEGSTSPATIDFVSDCGSASGNSGPGVWYTVLGTGTSISASTCNSETTFDTQISVFSGDCNNLECIDGSDDGCGLQSRVTWLSVADTPYYVLVHGLGDSGDFRLDVDELGDPPENNACDGAIGPLSIPSSTQGSTFAATVDNVANCGSAYGGDGPGVWYKVLGTGNLLSASTCNNETNFDTQISIFSGDCNSLTCVTGDDEGCGDGFQSIANWASVSGITYYVLVHGVFGESGDFQIDIEDLGSPLANDACDGAIGPLSIPSSTEGSTSAATIDNVQDCGTAEGRFSPGPGLWYTVEGTGNRIVASTCNEGTSFDTQISVFSSGCSVLQCIAGNDEGEAGCRLNDIGQSLVSWSSDAGVTYLVLVHGYFGETGNFTLDIEEG